MVSFCGWFAVALVDFLITYWVCCLLSLVCLSDVGLDGIVGFFLLA